MKKTLLVVVSAVLAFALVSCANGAGNGKRAITQSQGNSGAQNQNGGTWKSLGDVLTEKDYILKNKADGVQISGSTVTFAANKDVGFLLPENVKSIRFRLPLVEDKTTIASNSSNTNSSLAFSISYMAGDVGDDGSVRLLGFPIHYNLAMGDNDVNNNPLRTNSHSSTLNGICGLAQGKTGVTYIAAGGFAELQRTIIGVGDGFLVELSLTDDGSLYCKNVEKDAAVTIGKVPESVVTTYAADNIAPRLGISRHNWFEGQLVLSDVEVFVE